MRNKINIILWIALFCIIALANPVDAVEKYYIKTTGGKGSSNVSTNNYSGASKVVNSYLQTNTDGTISRIEHTDNTVIIETYDSSFKLKSQKTIPKELNYFGGFYSGRDYNFLVYGQENYNEDDSVEVMRIVKYSKQWQRIGSSSLKGNNTYDIFTGGSCRMTETRRSIICRYSTYNV